MQQITPCLLCNGQDEDAMSFYMSVFQNAEGISITRYGAAGPGPKGSVITGTLRMEGQDFYALNGKPAFAFSQALSFLVHCETQQEADELWDKLSAGGETQKCGWLKDKFGVSWQIIPAALDKLMNDRDKKKAQSVMKAMLQMGKIDIAVLQQAYDQP